MTAVSSGKTGRLTQSAMVFSPPIPHPVAFTFGRKKRGSFSESGTHHVTMMTLPPGAATRVSSPMNLVLSGMCSPLSIDHTRSNELSANGMFSASATWSKTRHENQPLQPLTSHPHMPPFCSTSFSPPHGPWVAILFSCPHTR